MLRHLPTVTDPRALVGASTSDDAAVYQVSDDLAIVATVDYITPVVDDPYAWGRVAAANALSDVYAMGAQPLFALNVVNFPRDTLPLSDLERVLQGGASAAAEAGIPILGGHSVDDPEPKYGLVALGMVAPDRVLRNVGARPGDVLVLTKPLGIGIATTAIKRGIANEDLIARAVGVMSALNRAAGEVIAASDAVHAATDVTGFGLLGHLCEMLGGGAVGAEISLSAVPVLEDAWSLACEGVVPGGSHRNLASLDPLVKWPTTITESQRLVLADAQTSGGLLVAVDPAAAPALLGQLHARGVSWATPIGHFTATPGSVNVLP